MRNIDIKIVWVSYLSQICRNIVNMEWHHINFISKMEQIEYIMSITIINTPRSIILQYLCSEIYTNRQYKT